MKTEPRRGKEEEKLLIIYMALGFQSLVSFLAVHSGGLCMKRPPEPDSGTSHSPLSKPLPVARAPWLRCCPPLPQTRSPDRAPFSHLRRAPVTEMLLSATTQRLSADILPVAYDL